MGGETGCALRSERFTARQGIRHDGAGQVQHGSYLWRPPVSRYIRPRSDSRSKGNRDALAGLARRRPARVPQDAMTSRTLHRIIGVVLVLPMAGWAVTGFIFFVKPGYGGAYESLTVRTYPLDRDALAQDSTNNRIQAELGSWLEYRVFRTILGEHLLVRTAAGWHHLNPSTRQPMPVPSDDEVKRLVTDAFAANPPRYGNITRVDRGVISTDTGVEV